MTSKERVLAAMHHIQADANMDNLIAMAGEVKGVDFGDDHKY